MAEDISIGSMIKKTKKNKIFAKIQKEINQEIEENEEDFDQDDFFILQNKEVGGK